MNMHQKSPILRAGQWPRLLVWVFFVNTLVLFSAGCTPLRPASFAFEASEVQARMQADVEFLASDSMGGRPPGTHFERIAADYIEKRWLEAGLKSKEWEFEVKKNGDSLIRSLNISAFLDSKADSTIVIAAHFDHLGQGGDKSREFFKKGIHPGADDNASGVAMMLELARHLASTPSRSYNYLFLGLSCHEIGLYGSRAFAESDYAKNLKTKLFLNLDMVGRLNNTSKTIRFSFCRSFPELGSLAEIKMPNGLKLRPDMENETRNDYSILCEEGYPAISLTSGIHDDYHRMSDRPSEINYPGMLMILDYCKRIVSP